MNIKTADDGAGGGWGEGGGRGGGTERNYHNIKDYE
jgi:hypothetical protein